MNNPFKLKCGPKTAWTYWIPLLPSLFYIQACAAIPSSQPKPLLEESNAIRPPQETNGNSVSASELYQVPVPAMSQEQIRQQLETIDEIFKSGDYEKARLEADKIKGEALSPQMLAQLNLLYAQINLSVGEAELALENLKQIQPYFLSTEQKIDSLRAKAFALSLSGHLMDSAKTRIDLDRFLTSSEALEQNQNAILETLNLLSDDDLKAAEQSANSNLAGWIALSRIYKLKDQPGFSALLKHWRTDYREHPVDVEQLMNSSQIDTAGSDVYFPGSIAVILPTSGPLAGAGKAIKAGIMASFNALDNTGYKPNLHFYDSEQAPPENLYNEAVSAGAELIIGPLDKKDIQRLADTATLDIPVLALNHIPNLEQDNLYQFALSPMDDVEQISAKATRDGHKKALLLIPETPQTQRIADYFKEYWVSPNSAIVRMLTYRPQQADYSSAIANLLVSIENGPVEAEPSLSTHPNSAMKASDINSSKEAVNRVKPLAATANTKFDADAIFISAYNSDARAIKQALISHGAENMAVYALPNIYLGQANPAKDQILDNAVFCDMPWLFDKGYQGNLSMKALSSIRRQFPETYLRLIAMGIDAFNLSARLKNINSRSYWGATGKLSLAKDNRIKRELICAVFRQGQPATTGYANEPENNLR